MKPLLSRWLLLWLRARKVPSLTDEEILHFLSVGNKSRIDVIEKMKRHLHDEHLKMMNLGHDWLNSFLPFVLSKINRVHFGLLQPHDLRLLEESGVKIPTSRKLVAVPFVAKDVPSRASEFAHPDVLIGVTILAYRYEGLRKSDFKLMLKMMKDCLEDEGGPYKDRPTYQRFEHWILTCGKAIRGSKKRPKPGQKYLFIEQKTDEDLALKARLEKRYKDSIFGQIFDVEEDLIWPIQLIDGNDKEQFKVLFPLLSRLPHAVMYYLNDLIFPEVLAYQGLKLSACGQELGGDLLFGKKIGFSGTPSDILPQELGSCQYERGSDGKVVHYLTSPDIAKIEMVPAKWDAKSILEMIAQANPPYHALIDTGALITGMTNKAAAEYMLKVGLSTMKGVVFLDEEDRQMVLLRQGMKVVKLADCGLAFGERFSFYDHVHTTGMDIKQAVDARAALTLGKDMVFRDYAQGAFRMRGIGKGQTIILFVTPEVNDLIKKHVSIGATGKAGAPGVGDATNSVRFLKDVVSWLVINSMRVDSIQYNLLCEQSVSNIWRKRCFNVLMKGYRDIDSMDRCSPQVVRALKVFRERLDFEIENSIPLSIKYSEKIKKLIDSNGYVDFFLNLIKVVNDFHLC